jgi:oligoendopeptidase F
MPRRSHRVSVGLAEEGSGADGNKEEAVWREKGSTIQERWRAEVNAQEKGQVMARKRTPGGYKKPMKVKIKKSRQGSLRAHTKTPKGKKIPVKTLQRLKKSKSPAMRKKATFALNARKWRKVGGRRKRK